MSDVVGRALPPTDRELLFEAQQEQADEAVVMQQIQHYRALGMGAAAFVLSMWQGLEESGLSRDEKLVLMQAALRGR